MIIAPPNPESREIAGALTDLEVRMRRAEAGLRAAQLKNSSITNGGVNLYDGDGRLRGVIGRNPDGTYAATSTNNPDPPPVPASPIVTAALASLIVRHNGETQSGVQFPADFSHLNIWYSQAQNPDDWTNGGSLLKLPDELPIAPLEYTDYLVSVSAVNLSGKESEKSEPVSGSPRQVVPNDLIEHIFADLELSAGQVTEAALAAGAVTVTKIADNAIESPKIAAGQILGVHILADQIDGGKLIAQAITSREIQALAVIAGKIDVNAVTAGTIAVGAVTAVKLEANLVISSRFIAGAPSGNRVEMHPTQGLQAYTNGGATRSFWIDAATGNALLIGEIRTAASGGRIVINPGNTNPDRIEFWPDAAGGSADFAYIDSFPDGAVDTGITMQASGGQTSKVATVWLRRAYAALGMSDNSLIAGSQFYAEPNFVRCRSATIDLMIDQGIAPVNGPRRVVFLNVNTANQPVVNSSLFYGTATANQYPIFYKPEFNLGMIWDGGGYIAFVHNDAAYTRAPIEASEFRVSSDSRMKTSVQDIDWDGGALGVITANPSKMWKRRTPGPSQHLEEGATPQIAKPDGQGGVYKDGNGDTVFRSVPLKVENPWFFGPMADRLPPELVHTDSDTGMKSIGIVSMLGVSWKAIEELSTKVDELTARIKELENVGL
jgi:hypothetical protein